MATKLFLLLYSGWQNQGNAHAPTCSIDGKHYMDEKVWSPNGGVQTDASGCQRVCLADVGCSFWTFYNSSHMCWLLGQHATLGTIPDSTATSGPKSCNAMEVPLQFPESVEPATAITGKKTSLEDALEQIQRSGSLAMQHLEGKAVPLRSVLEHPFHLMEPEAVTDTTSFRGLPWFIAVVALLCAAATAATVLWLLRNQDSIDSEVEPTDQDALVEIPTIELASQRLATTRQSIHALDSAMRTDRPQPMVSADPEQQSTNLV
ncbi:unnamed protein product [Symbiodinium pilosum]|uniref:Apple domain-containing protein n=1 Tax=Symbiodinium pilosum TaxID=2952 RepID=A0A812XL07_SYMPI|nr:unnamed protein product [Symbiodinium pilosum]